MRGLFSVLVMQDAAVVESGTVDQVLAQPQRDNTRILLGATG